MRPEACAYVLTTANVRSGAATIVVGDMSGALCGAVLERLGATERILLLHGARRRPGLNALRHWGASFAGRVDVAPLGSSAAGEWANARGGADALIITHHFDPRLALPAALPLLSLSSPFAVFCPYVEVLRAAPSCRNVTKNNSHVIV
jgi:hypothetical protein